MKTQIFHSLKEILRSVLVCARSCGTGQPFSGVCYSGQQMNVPQAASNVILNNDLRINVPLEVRGTFLKMDLALFFWKEC